MRHGGLVGEPRHKAVVKDSDVRAVLVDEHQAGLDGRYYILSAKLEVVCLALFHFSLFFGGQTLEHLRRLRVLIGGHVGHFSEIGFLLIRESRGISVLPMPVHRRLIIICIGGAAHSAALSRKIGRRGGERVIVGIYLDLRRRHIVAAGRENGNVGTAFGVEFQ